MAAILIVPGYQNSGPGHWQSLWEGSLREAKRVEMPNWDFPHKVDWVEALDEAIADGVAPPILAASADDPHMDPSRARALAADWGARFVDLGPCGHLNLASGHGPWPRGEALLSEFR